ncbi:MAG: hypothetical protein ACREI2_00060 [Nitrospiraceae bacterium]
MESKTHTYRQVSLSVRYNSVLFPFDTIQFLSTISKEGFLQQQQPVGPLPPGVRIEASGIVGRKGAVSVRIDADRLIFGVNAPDVETVLSEMNTLESLLKSAHSFESSSLAKFYELLAGITIKAKKNPVECWRSHFAEVPVLKKMSQLLERRISPFGVRLAPSGELPNQTNWFEIHIVPNVPLSTDYHDVEVVYRHSSREDVFTFAKKLDAVLSAILSIVEQG